MIPSWRRRSCVKIADLIILTGDHRPSKLILTADGWLRLTNHNISKIITRKEGNWLEIFTLKCATQRLQHVLLLYPGVAKPSGVHYSCFVIEGCLEASRDWVDWRGCLEWTPFDVVQTRTLINDAIAKCRLTDTGYTNNNRSCVRALRLSKDQVYTRLRTHNAAGLIYFPCDERTNLFD